MPGSAPPGALARGFLRGYSYCSRCTVGAVQRATDPGRWFQKQLKGAPRGAEPVERHPAPVTRGFCRGMLCRPRGNIDVWAMPRLSRGREQERACEPPVSGTRRAAASCRRGGRWLRIGWVKLPALAVTSRAWIGTAPATAPAFLRTGFQRRDGVFPQCLSGFHTFSTGKNFPAPRATATTGHLAPFAHAQPPGPDAGASGGWEGAVFPGDVDPRLRWRSSAGVSWSGRSGFPVAPGGPQSSACRCGGPGGWQKRPARPRPGLGVGQVRTYGRTPASI